MLHRALVMEHIEILSEIINTKRKSGTIGSLRDLALAVGIDSGTLSRIMRGERRITIHVAIAIVASLDLSDEISQTFFRSVIRENIYRSLIESFADLRGIALNDFFQNYPSLKFSPKEIFFEALAEACDGLRADLSNDE